MKSSPTSKSVGNRHGRALLGLVLSTMTLLSVWLFASSYIGQVQHVFGADLAFAPVVATAPTVPTVPTVPTLPTVPTDATATATSVSGTATPTTTPVPAADDKKLDRIGTGPLTGNYCMVSGGAGLTLASSGTFTLQIDGTVVAAYLVWSGRYPDSNAGDNKVNIAINGDPAVQFMAVKSLEALSGWDGRNHHTYISENLATSSLASKLAGALNVEVSGLNSGGTESDQGHGIGLFVIYESAANCPITQVDLFFGLDGFHHRFTPPFGPNSEVLCVDVPASTDSRVMEVQLFVGGAEGSRPNAIWAQTGSGVKPTNLVGNGTATEIDGPNSTGHPALTANVGEQWDNYKNAVTIPAGATYACFQIESVEPAIAAAAPVRKQPSADIILDTAPFGTSGVWVSMVTRLLPGSGGSPATPTATATATGVVPTATATATGVVPTATATGTVPTATATATATKIPVGPTVTPTVTPTEVAQCKPALAFTVTSRPSPPHPGRPLTYFINFHSTNNCSIHGLKFSLHIPFFTFFFGGGSSAQSIEQLRNAGWQCAANTPNSACEYIVGDIAGNQSGVVEFPVNVDSNVPIGTALKLHVTASDADGNTSTASNVDYDVIVEAFEVLLPLINK